MRKTLSELLRESYLAEQSVTEQPQFRHPGQAIPVNPGGAPANPAPAPAPGAKAPANPLQNRIDIKSASGASFIVGYLESSKGWCVYTRKPGAPNAQLWAGPLRSLADAFAKVAQGL